MVVNAQRSPLNMPDQNKDLACILREIALVWQRQWQTLNK